MNSASFNETLEEVYKLQKIDEKYEEAVKYFTNLQEEYLVEYLKKNGLPPELIQAYLNIEAPKRARNTYLRGWGAHKSDSTDTGDGESIMYDPTRDFRHKEVRRSTSKANYTYTANNAAYPEDELDSDPYNNYNNTTNALTGKNSNYANSNLNGFTMEIDYGNCKYELLNKEETFNYLGISGVRSVTAADNPKNVPWLSANANPYLRLPSNENRVAFIANSINTDTFQTNLSSLRFLFREDNGQYRLISYDDSHLMTNGNIMQLYKIMIPRRNFDQGDLHIAFPKDKNSQSTLDSAFIDRRVTGVLLVIMLADKIYKTDELQHRLINPKAAPSSEIRRHLNFRYLGTRDSSGNITRPDTTSAPNINVLFNVLSKNYMNQQKFGALSLSPLYNEYLYLSTIAEILNNASGFHDVEDWGQITADNLKEFMLREENRDIFVQTDNPETYPDPDRNQPFNNNYPLLLNDLKVLNIYRNAQPIEDYINNRVNDEHFVFLKEIANIEGDYSYFNLNVNLTIYFTNETKDAIQAYKVTNNNNDKVISTLSRDVTEKIYGKIIDIYFPPEDEEYKRLNNLYKRNIFNRLIITKPKRKGAYLRPAADNPEDPNFINNFQTFKPLQNYISVLSDDSNLVYDLILDTGDHNPRKTRQRDRQYANLDNHILDQLTTAWQACKDNKKAMLHDKKAYERVLKNKDSYTGDDAEEDYQDDLNDAKEVYETSLNAYKHALKQKQAIIDKYCSVISQTTLYIERAIVEYFTVLEGKLKLLRQLKDKVLSLESYSLDDIFKEFKGESSPLLQQIEKKMEELQKLLQEQEIQLQRIQQRKTELQNRIADLQRQLAEATQNLANSETEEQEVNQVKSQIQTQLKELNDAKQPDNAKAVSEYYRTREKAEEVCISLGNDIDTFRKSIFKPEGSEPQADNKANNKTKKVESNPKILEALDLMEDTVDAVADGLKADEKDKEIIDTLTTDPNVNDIMDDVEDNSNEDNE